MSKLLEQINTAKRKNIRLFDVASRIGDGLHGTPKYDDNGDYFFINGNNLDNGHVSIKKDTRRVNESAYLKHKKDLGERTLLLSINGTIGNLAKYGGEKCILGKSACYINIKPEFILDYIYYALLDWRFQKHIENNANGSTIKNVSLGQLRDYAFDIPDLPTQKKIAEILSAYDAKIENNNKIIKNLETTAQTIFDEWFARFRFPGHEKAKFVESEMGEIPEGWGVGKVKDLINVESGFPFSSSLFHKEGKYKLVTIRNVQDGEFVLDCDNKILELPEKLPEHCKLLTGNILLSLTGNVGRICLVIGSDYVLNQRVSNLVPIKETNRAFTYFLFRQKEFQNLLISMGKGSAQSNLSPIDTKNIGIVIPNNQTLEKFNQQIFSFFEQIISLKEENISLTSLRDQLLAKLI